MRNATIFEGVLPLARVEKMFESLVEDFSYVLVSDQEVQWPQHNTFVWTMPCWGSILITVDAAVNARGCALAFLQGPI